MQGRQLDRFLAISAIVLAFVAVNTAHASTLIARQTSSVSIQVDSGGRALVVYRQQGKIVHVLASGAINEQTRMRLDYSGGRGAWKTFVDVSRPYTGPALPWLVTAVQAPDGSYWALQSWQRKLPNKGAEPTTAIQRSFELHLSHWQGELPVLEVWTDWVWHGRFKHLFGRYTYKGQPVFGFGNTPAGVPTDPYGRNLYLDTFASAYGPGWERENSFLTHRPRGTFCYGFYRHGSVSGEGTRYRITVQGPGVTPVVSWEGTDPGAYDPTRDAELNALQREIVADDPRCQTP